MLKWLGNRAEIMVDKHEKLSDTHLGWFGSDCVNESFLISQCGTTEKKKVAMQNTGFYSYLAKKKV